MTVRRYYRHARSLGKFRAIDCLAIARKCAALDWDAAAARLIANAQIANRSTQGHQTTQEPV